MKAIASIANIATTAFVLINPRQNYFFRTTSSFIAAFNFSPVVTTTASTTVARMNASSVSKHDGPTTNEEDQRKVAELKERLKKENSVSKKTADAASNVVLIPSVQLAEGTHKYVLIRATYNDGEDEQYIVTSRAGASYHQDAAEPVLAQLRTAGYTTSVTVTGGGRIALDTPGKTCAVYGFSYGFGLADHSISKETILSDDRYTQFHITTSDEGY